MATVNATVLRHHRKKDGTWNVKIRVSLNGKTSYIDTQHFVNKKQLKKDLTLGDQFIISLLNPILDEFRKKISELGERLERFTVKQLAEHLVKGEVTADGIDILAFGRERLKVLEEKGRLASRNDLRKVVNSLADYFGNDFVPVTEINSKMLERYENFLRSPRTMVRKDQFGRMLERKARGLSDLGLHNHMRDLRILFNEAVKHYNDSEIGQLIISHYPFKNYKIASPPESNKRKLGAKQIVNVCTCPVIPGSRAELARDLFMLSFYLCGMNPIDIYNLPDFKEQVPNRIDYNRAKTKGRRKDRAFISIAIPDVALDILGRYAGTLQERYGTHTSFDRALSFGMREVGKLLGIEKLQFYDARHAFADMARNRCGFSKDDVALALNHKDNSNSVTDVYLSKDWTIIDRVQRSVLSLLEAPRRSGLCNMVTFKVKCVSYTSPSLRDSDIHIHGR